MIGFNVLFVNLLGWFNTAVSLVLSPVLDFPGPTADVIYRHRRAVVLAGAMCSCTTSARLPSTNFLFLLFFLFCCCVSVSVFCLV